MLMTRLERRAESLGVKQNEVVPSALDDGIGDDSCGVKKHIAMGQVQSRISPQEIETGKYGIIRSCGCAQHFGSRDAFSLAVQKHEVGKSPTDIDRDGKPMNHQSFPVSGAPQKALLLAVSS